MSLTVLLGGARSGKSTLAVEIGQRFDGAVTFIATAPRLDGDMVSRIERHIAERPDHWVTVEEEIDLAEVVSAAADGLVIIDCLTLWTSNLMFTDHTPDAIDAATDAAVRAVRDHAGQVVVVSNEVGLGVVPDNAMARTYRDLHGRINQRFVEHADRALHLVAGRATPLVDPWSLLD